MLCVDGVVPGRRGLCQCGCLGLNAGCARVVCAVWSGVMAGSQACAAGWWRMWPVVWCPVRAVGAASVWAGLCCSFWLDCLVGAAWMGGPAGGRGVCGGGWRVWWWWRDGVPLRVLLWVVPLGAWFLVTEHSPFWAARALWSGSPSPVYISGSKKGLVETAEIAGQLQVTLKNDAMERGFCISHKPSHLLHGLGSSFSWFAS